MLPLIRISDLSKTYVVGVKFLTIRRRGKSIVEELNALPPANWRKVRVHDSTGKGRMVSVVDQSVVLRDYGGELRQVAIAGQSKSRNIKSASPLSTVCTSIIPGTSGRMTA